MRMAPTSFQLPDLPSQAAAVGRILSGLSESGKLSWIGERGKLRSITVHGLCDRWVYTFESTIGLRCVFMIVGDDFALFGDNTAYVVHFLEKGCHLRRRSRHLDLGGFRRPRGRP